MKDYLNMTSGNFYGNINLEVGYMLEHPQSFTYFVVKIVKIGQSAGKFSFQLIEQ